MAYFSNGTEGMAYQEEYCDKCANADADGMCAVCDAHLLFSYGAKDDVKSILDTLIPQGKDGFAGQCNMYRKSA